MKIGLFRRSETLPFYRWACETPMVARATLNRRIDDQVGKGVTPRKNAIYDKIPKGLPSGVSRQRSSCLGWRSRMWLPTCTLFLITYHQTQERNPLCLREFGVRTPAGWRESARPESRGKILREQRRKRIAYLGLRIHHVALEKRSYVCIDLLRITFSPPANPQ